MYKMANIEMINFFKEKKSDCKVRHLTEVSYDDGQFYG